MADAMPSFDATQVAVLRQAFAFALSYLPPLLKSERCLLATLTSVAAGARFRAGDGLDTFIDAHVLAAEMIDIFTLMQRIGAADAD